jgi:dihydrodipicolinate synthase/N-acetylneuraminate lyase
VNLWDAVRDQQWDKARDLHERLMPLWDAIGQDNMPSLCKYAQKLQGVDAGFARRPTSPATESQQAQVREAFRATQHVTSLHKKADEHNPNHCYVGACLIRMSCQLPQ